MELNLKIAGILQIALGLFHAFFPRRFGWREELASISLLSRQMMYVHTLFIALTIILMGVLCLTSTGELTGTALGRRICLGFGIFWLARLIVQFFGYSSELWRGKRFETIVHIVFSVMWVYLTATFMIASLA